MNLNARYGAPVPVSLEALAAQMQMQQQPQQPAVLTSSTSPCGCSGGPTSDAAAGALSGEPLSRALTGFAPTSSWSSNVFGGNSAHTGQVNPATAGADTWSMLASGLGIAGTALGAYHGYRRTGSIPWAIGWALLGGLFPIITIPVAYAQGFGKPDPAFKGARR